MAINTNATGLYLQGGGVVVNGATGTISIDTAVSGIGVRLNAVGTVTNAGTIIRPVAKVPSLPPPVHPTR